MRLHSGVSLAVFSLAATGWAMPLETLQETGPAANRINLVLTGDGYRAQDQEKLSNDARGLVKSLFEKPPFQQYQSLFNVQLIHAESIQNGIDFGDLGSSRSTRYGGTFNCGGTGRAIRVDEEVVLRDAADNVPGYDYVVVLANETRRGGSASRKIAKLSMREGSENTFSHELGHVIGRLADEYESANSSYPTCEARTDCLQPNVTIRSTLSELKWASWVNPALPIPTPETKRYTCVGLFEGARYQAKGVYRPIDQDCAMRRNERPFCPVCTEALVLRFLSTVTLVDMAEPAPGAISACEEPKVFSVTLLPFQNGKMRLQWLLNGIVKVDNITSVTLS